MTSRTAPPSPADLAALSAAGWDCGEKIIKKVFVFENFNEAIAFMVRCAAEIEKLDHHPEWCNVYNKVTVGLTTHDAGGVTAKDGELARIMDRIAAGLSVKG